MSSGATAAGRPCTGCGTEVAATLLACPSCHQLVHAEGLKRHAEEAEHAAAAGDARAAREAWRSALDLLPRDSVQAGIVAQRIAALDTQVGAAPSPGANPAASETRDRGPALKKAGPLAALGLLAWKLKFFVLAALSKAKLLLLGLTKAGTLLTMLLSFGVYWTMWGWRFALGFVAAMYVHEIGHVAALRHYGIKATAPMFVPGLGAFVRMSQYPATPAEDARVGLAGPLWGLAASVVGFGVYLATAGPVWAAIARSSAWLNLFNLLPVWQLDGGRGLNALSSRQRFAIAAGAGGMWLVTREGLLLLVAGAAAVRAFGGGSAEQDDTGALALFLFLIGALSALVALPVPGLSAS